MIPDGDLSRLTAPLSLSLLAGVLLGEGLVVGAGQDASVYALAGVQVSHGLMPYRDIFDNKPPGSYLLNALGESATRWLDPWAVAWLVSAVSTIGAVLVLYALLARSVGRLSAWFWTAASTLLMAGYLMALGGGLTETFAILPITLALWLAVTPGRDRRRFVAIGLLIGITCSISLQFVTAGASVFVGAACVKSRDRALWRAALMLFGAAVPTVAVLAWLAHGGVLAAAFEQLISYNAAYRESGPGLVQLLPVAAVAIGGFCVPTAFEILRMTRKPSGSDVLGWISLAWLLTGLIYVFGQKWLFPHYLIAFGPPLAILSGRGYSALWSYVKSGRSRVLAPFAAAAATAAFLISTTITVGFGQAEALAAGQSNASSDQAAEWIRVHYPQSGTLFVWGYDPVLYLKSGMKPADQYVYLFPLITAGYGSDARTAELVSRWHATPPDVIVEVDSSVPLNRPKLQTTDRRELDTLQSLRDFVRARYRRAASFPKQDVYVLIPGP